MKILIMGLPGAGKTYLAERLVKLIGDCAWFNADVIRGAANDWDFSPEGRVRQAQRMKTFADFESSHGRNVICDFVAPTKAARDQFAADVVIWLNTITAGRFADTNAMFEPPSRVDFTINTHYNDEQIEDLARQIINKLRK